MTNKKKKITLELEYSTTMADFAIENKFRSIFEDKDYSFVNNENIKVIGFSIK